jgi:hypothetical protein
LVFIKNTSAFLLTLDGNSSETINGSLTYPMMPGASVMLLGWNGTGPNWIVVAADTPPVTVTFTDTQVKALPTTPLTILPAPGSGFYINWSRVELISKFATAAYTNVNTTLCELQANNVGVGVSTVVANDSTTTPAVTAATRFFGAASRRVGLLPYHESIVRASGENLVVPYLADGTVGVDAMSSFDNVVLRLSCNNNGSGDFTGGNAANTLVARVAYTIDVVP